jgi:hypothetical protein
MEGDELTGWKPGTPTSFLSTAALEREPMFSPDGKVAGVPGERPRPFGVYVRPFRGPGGTWRISTAGGITPTWSRTRREFLYRSPENQLMVAAYTTSGDSFRAETPRLWAEATSVRRRDNAPSTCTPTASASPLPPELGSFDRPQDRLVFILNFFDELLRMAATAKR